MKKNIFRMMVIAFILFLAVGCGAVQNKKIDSIRCSLTTTSGFEQYGNIAYYTSTKFDGTNNVVLDIDVNFTKVNVTDDKLGTINTQMKTKFSNGLFSNAPVCESTYGNNVIKFHITGTMVQVYKTFGSSNFDLENVKSYLETTEHMTCAVESE